MPSRSPRDDPAVAATFFEAAGKRERVAAGTKFFVENEKNSRMFFHRDKMYLLAEGEVTLAVGHEAIGTVTKGEIFGEIYLARLTRDDARAYPETGSFFSSARRWATGTPRSTSAPSIMSPLIPAKQSR